jgi:hypothetical protein
MRLAQTGTNMKKTRAAVNFSLSFLMLQTAHSAQYKVVELPVADLGTSSFPSAINNSGDVAVNLQAKYNPAIDLSLVNWNSATIIANLTDIEAAQSGDFNDADYHFLYAYIVSNSESLFFQQIASLNAYVSSDDSAAQIIGFDSIDTDTNEYSNSVTTEIESINDYGYVVGVSQDSFYTVAYTNENIVDLTYVVNDFYARAFVQLGSKTVALPPPDISAGGLSKAFDINANNQIVGIGTTAILDTVQTSVDACLDDDLRGDLPVAACLRSLSISLNANVTSLSQRRGIVWQVDEKGNVTDTFTLGMLITPSESDSTLYSSSAVAINDYGVAVGQSPAYYLDTTSMMTASAIYIGEKVSTINADENVYSSAANDVNNDNLVVGYANKLVNGSATNKFFVHDIDADLTSYPDDFFVTSASTATAINNQGMVVGYAEPEVTLGVRRTEGFIYDYRNDLFAGLDSLLECNSAYTITQANDINDDNEIAATALVKRAVRNIQGEIVYDSLGAQTEAYQVVAVKLEPISGGSVDNCDVYVEEQEVRQGAGLSWLLMLFGFAFSLRRVRKVIS